MRTRRGVTEEQQPDGERSDSGCNGNSWSQQTLVLQQPRRRERSKRCGRSEN